MTSKERAEKDLLAQLREEMAAYAALSETEKDAVAQAEMAVIVRAEAKS